VPAREAPVAPLHTLAAVRDKCLTADLWKIIKVNLHCADSIENFNLGEGFLVTLFATLASAFQTIGELLTAFDADSIEGEAFLITFLARLKSRCAFETVGEQVSALDADSVDGEAFLLTFLARHGAGCAFETVGELVSAFEADSVDGEAFLVTCLTRFEAWCAFETIWELVCAFGARETTTAGIVTMLLVIAILLAQMSSLHSRALVVNESAGFSEDE